MEVENTYFIRQPGLHPSSFRHLKYFLRVGCWNVRSLVEADGGVKTATVRTGKHPVAVDRKIKFLVNELKCFRMGAVCISETKWFGSDLYEVDGFTVLHSGHDLPQPGNAFQCGGGVAVILDPVMTQAWRDAGESWLAVNSRIVFVRLQFGDKHPSGSQQYVSIISVYTPTHRAPAS